GELLGRRQQRALADLVQVDLGDVVEEIRADALGWNLERQLLRLRVRFACGSRVFFVRAWRIGRHAGGRYRVGSTGLPRRRISKCSLTWSASVSPISAIFCPLATCWPSLTSISLLCAYADRKVALCLTMMSLP